MAYDVQLAENLRSALSNMRGIREQTAFGSLCFMYQGNMLCSAASDRYMFRVGKDLEADALQRPGARVMSFKGRSRPGFIWIDPALCDGSAIDAWITLALQFVAALPPKLKK